MINVTVLEEEWTQCLESWGANPSKAKKWFTYLVGQYTSQDRKYHTLNHIADMLDLAKKAKIRVHNWKAFYLAIWFHDVIQGKLTGNEKLSAQKCLEAINDLKLPACGTESVQLILATRSHEKSESDDVKLFIDLDLAILGSSEKIYLQYAQQCRDEYKVPSLLYRQGRVKVLKNFLRRDHIYQTNYFKINFENKARENIAREVVELKKGLPL